MSSLRVFPGLPDIVQPRATQTLALQSPDYNNLDSKPVTAQCFKFMVVDDLNKHLNAVPNVSTSRAKRSPSSPKTKRQSFRTIH